MNRRELISQTVKVLADNDMTKPVSIPKQTLHISDDNGNVRTFSIKKEDKQVPFTTSDVDKVVSVIEEVIKDCLKMGEQVSIRGFGTLGLYYRKPRTTKHPKTREETVIPGRYVPKFNYGNDLKMCGRIFEMAIKDGILRYTNEDDDPEIDDDVPEGGDE